MIAEPVRSEYELPTGYLSPSQVIEFMKCGQCYKWNRIDRVPRPIGIALPIGSAVHKAVEAIRKVSLEQGGDPFVLDHYAEVAAEHFDAQVSAPVDEESGTELVIDLKDHGSLGEAKDQAVALTKFLLPKIAEVDRQRGLLVSEYDLAELPEEVRAAAWPFEMRGRIDALYGDQSTGVANAMVDLKTSSKRSAPDNFASLQFSIYGYHFFAAGQSIRLGADVVTKKRIPDFDTYWLGQNGEVSELEYTAVRQIVLGVAEDISAGRFPARPSFYCAYEHGLPSFSVAVSGFGDAA